MTAIVVLNIAFSALVIVGIPALLGWGIVSNRAMSEGLANHARRRSRTGAVRDRTSNASRGRPSTASQLSS